MADERPRETVGPRDAGFGESEPTWTLSMDPEEYLKRHPEGPNADLARRVLEEE